MSSARPSSTALRMRRYRKRQRLARNGGNGGVTPNGNGNGHSAQAEALAALTYTIALRNLRSYREHLVPVLTAGQRGEFTREIAELWLAILAPVLGLQPESSVTHGTVYR
jgi:hypothetical protein